MSNVTLDGNDAPAPGGVDGERALIFAEAALESLQTGSAVAVPAVS